VHTCGKIESTPRRGFSQIKQEIDHEIVGKGKRDDARPGKETLPKTHLGAAGNV
jgi:hypothetical protein